MAFAELQKTVETVVEDCVHLVALTSKVLKFLDVKCYEKLFWKLVN